MSSSDREGASDRPVDRRPRQDSRGGEHDPFQVRAAGTMMDPLADPATPEQGLPPRSPGRVMPSGAGDRTEGGGRIPPVERDPPPQA